MEEFERGKTWERYCKYVGFASLGELEEKRERIEGKISKTIPARFQFLALKLLQDTIEYLKKGSERKDIVIDRGEYWAKVEQKAKKESWGQPSGARVIKYTEKDI